MGNAKEDAVGAAAVAAVEAFVLRGRRVMAHSLARSPERLWQLSRGESQIEVDLRTGVSTWITTLPTEEVVESLAARVRPLLLQRDEVHHGKVLSSLGYLLRQGDAPDAAEYLKKLRKAWQQIDANSDRARGYRLEKREAGDECPASAASDNTLAFGWFYGDVVHADRGKRPAARDFSVTDRYEAAVPVVALAAWYVHLTLHFIRQLQADEVLSLSDSVWENDVVVTTTEIRRPADVFVAPPGAEAPGFGQPFDGPWRPLVTRLNEREAPTEGSASG